MRKNKKLLAIAAVLFCSAVLVWLSTSTQAKQKTDNSINDSYSDQGIHHNKRNFKGSKYYSVVAGPGLLGYPYGENQAVYGYERLLDRYIDMNEKDLADIKTDLKKTLKKLDSINLQLKKLSNRLSRIEKALNITPQTTQKRN